ncbi:toxin-antitoxin system HicB family antitoxin [Catellatospora methionotrophica]|uniref:toxin-antitoxin system HicB family antitoxin n=1 Tax=Catellatospora methionotrophica TaxID=121620 RepID=UPI0033C8C045
MDLSPYLESLRRDLAAAAAPAGDDVARTAELLTLALDASARLCLIEVLADASAEITTKLDGPTVEVRIRGREADLVVSTPVAPAYEVAPAAPAPPLTEGGDQARLTLRLPEQLKEAAERAASAEGISVNAWLVRATANALRPVAPPPTSHLGRRVTGYAQA